MHITEVFYSDSVVYAHHGGFLFWLCGVCTSRRFIILTPQCMHITEVFYSDSAVYAHHGGFLFWLRGVCTSWRFFILTQWCMHITEVFYSDSVVYAHHGEFLFWLRGVCTSRRFFVLSKKNHRKIKTEFKNIFTCFSEYRTRWVQIMKISWHIPFKWLYLQLLIVIVTIVAAELEII